MSLLALERIACSWCLFTTCAISWPSTPASSASLESRFTRPREMKTVPPGSAKAFTVSPWITPKLHGRSGRPDVQGEPPADAVHVALQVRVGIERRGAEEARSEAVAEGHLFLVGEVAVGLGGLLGDVDGLVDDAAEVDRGSGRGGERERDAGEYHGSHRMASGVSIFTDASFASRAKRSAAPLSTR